MAAKVTEKLLLEKGTPKTNRLEQIKTLNLSGLGLKSKDLPVSLFSRLCNLEQLDLSGNHLVEMPPGLCLPSLRILNCSNNDMEDITSLEPLTALEELQLEDNLYLTVSDNYKVMFLLSKLRMFNGKDVSSSANHLRYVNSENLKKRVVSLWETSFSLPDPLTEEKLETLEREFVNAVRSQIKYGPSSLSDYTKWRLEMIAKEYLRSLTESEEEDAVETPVIKKSKGLSSPAKRKCTVIDVGDQGSAQKRPRTNEGNKLTEASPRRPTRLQNTHLKSDKASDSPSKVGHALDSPCGRKPTVESPRKPSKDAVVKATPHKKTKENTTAKVICSRDPVNLRPLHVLQCHSKQDSPEDFSTQLWACAFKPPLGDCEFNQTPRIVATCGGESVCLIDCETGHVLKKYKVPGEEFFSLSWSCVMMSHKGGIARSCSILAAGGKKGVVKLIHPRANTAYGEFRASRRALSSLRFNPWQPSFLFTGSYDNKIVMWDIGGVDSDYNFKVSQLLILETSSTPLHLGLPPSSPDTRLLAACDGGLYCFNIQLSKNILRRSEEMEIIFPAYGKEDQDNNYRTIDGLSFLTDDIVASKSHNQGSIYLWSWGRTQASRANKKKVSAVILAELQWSSTDVPYLSLSTCPGENYVVCGDENGSLWTYHITDLLKPGVKNGKMTPPTEILQWPSPVLKGHGAVEGPSINNVTMDPELHYLVALSDKNMVVVWKRV